MSSYTATVIKTGNSYALRVPKAYIEQAKLVLGQRVQVAPPAVASKVYDPVAARRAVRNLQAVGAFRAIKNPVTWQRSIRRDRPLPDRG